MIPVLVINLRRSTERARSIKAHLDSLAVPFEFVEAIDGVTMPASVASELNVRPYYGRRRLLSASEIACAASHLAACRRIASGAEEFVCVLEDDVRLFPEALAFLNEQSLRSLPKFDLLSLQGFNGHLVLPLTTIGDAFVCAPLRTRAGMVAQIYSRQGAGKIAATRHAVDSPIDHYLYLGGHVPGLRLLGVRPGTVSSLGGQSTISGRKKATAEGKKNRRPPSFTTEVQRATGLLGGRYRQFASFLRAWGVSSLGRIRYLPDGPRPHQRYREPA